MRFALGKNKARVAVGASATLLLMAGLAACGSSGSGGDTKVTSGSKDDAAAAQEALAPYLKPPTTIGIDTPLDSTPETGKTFVWMQCDAPQCAESTELYKEATAAVGWDLKVINYKTSDPATLVAGMRQALQVNPVAVSIVGLPKAVWGSVIPDYEKAGVPIVPMFVGPIDIDKTVIANIGGEDNATRAGQILANWFIADSKGVGNALLFTVPELGPAPAFKAGFEKTVKDGCSACKVTTLDSTFADVASGNIPGAITSKLQQDPSTKYVVSANQALAAGTAAALKSAGIDGVKLAGSSSEEAEENGVMTGELAAVTPTALNFATWSAMDAVLRYTEGMEQQDNSLLNTMLITKDSGITPSDSFNQPADWQDQFKKLWKVQ